MRKMQFGTRGRKDLYERREWGVWEIWGRSKHKVVFEMLKHDGENEREQKSRPQKFGQWMLMNP